MNTSQMINAFKIGYDIANHEGPGYEDEEIIFFLNKAQIAEVLKENGIRRFTYISNLLRNETLSTVSRPWSVYNYIRTVVPSGDYIGYMASRSRISRHTFKPTNSYEWVGNIFITKEQSYRYVSSSLNHSILIVPKVYEDENGTIGIVYDRHTVFDGNRDFSLDYIRRPHEITVNDPCELNDILHERVVNTAIDIGKNVWSSQEAGASQQVDKMISDPKL